MALRAFNIKNDLDVMIPLIKAAFHYPENDTWNLSPEEITSIVDDFSVIRQIYPVIQVGGLFNPTFKAIMRGYIWEEAGQAVGLVNLSPMGFDNQTWVIGNRGGGAVFAVLLFAIKDMLVVPRTLSFASRTCSCAPCPAVPHAAA